MNNTFIHIQGSIGLELVHLGPVPPWCRTTTFHQMTTFAHSPLLHLVSVTFIAHLSRIYRHFVTRVTFLAHLPENRTDFIMPASIRSPSFSGSASHTATT